jgi:ribosomal protein L37AE/L43A
MQSLAIYGLSPRPDVAHRAAGRANNSTEQPCPECGIGGFEWYCPACGHTLSNGATLGEATNALAMLHERARQALDHLTQLEHAACARQACGSWVPQTATSFGGYEALCHAADTVADHRARR